MRGPNGEELPGAVLFACTLNAVRSPIAAALMRQQGVTEGTLFINREAPCESCSRLLPRLLAPGSRLRVFLSNGKMLPFKGDPP